MVLVNPPVTKPCEMPAGITRLAGALRQAGHACRVIDMNLEGMLSALGSPVAKSDTWTARAERDLFLNLEALKSTKTYRSFDRYKRCVNDLNRLLSVGAQRDGVRVSLSDYEDARRSPLRSADLIAAAGRPEDNPFFGYFSARFREVFNEGSPCFAGFSLTYLSQALTAFAMIGFVRREFPGVQTILGGGLVTSWMSSPKWRNPFGGLVDYLVKGPGEDFLIGLSGGVSSDAPGRAFPDCAYDVFPGSDYLAPGMIMPFSTSTGCYYGKCSFCPERAEGNVYSQLAPAKTTAQLSRLAAQEGPALVHIVDNAVSPAMLGALAKNPPGAPWYGFARVTEELADQVFCNDLKRSGCVMLKLGVESGDQQVLDGMQKGIELAVVSKALKALARAGIGTYVYLLFGTPWEDEDAARKTLDLVAGHHDLIGFLNLAVFNLPHNSPDAAGLEVRPFYGGDLSFYADFVHPRGWDRKKVRRFIDREFTRHQAVRAIIKRQPPYFTSNHAPFFTDTFC